MAFVRQALFASAVTSIIACGGEGQTPPSGPHYGYVASEVEVPANNTQAREIGLDLNGDKVIDNQLGMVLGTLAGQGFKVQDTLDQAVLFGDIIILLDFQTPDFGSTTGAGLAIKLGDSSTPGACTDPANPTEATCGKHLNGDATFTIDPNSPDGAVVEGKIAGGVFSGGPGTITLQIALAGDAAPIELNLIGARAKATGISEEGVGDVILAGALTKEALDNDVIPTIHAQLPPLIERDCCVNEDCVANPPVPPGCGCPAGSTGKTILGLFDTDDPKDCAVTIEEIKTNSLIQSLLAPDVTIDGVDALSLGLRASFVSALFPGIE